MSAGEANPQRGNRDRRFVLTLAAVLLGAMVLVTLVSPQRQENDPRPTTYNAGSAGAKAAFLVLQDLGYKADRWQASTSGLRSLDAGHTTLVLADPTIDYQERKEVLGDVGAFLDHGGRVLLTGGDGTFLVPGAEIRSPKNPLRGLCETTPEGQGRLARAGQVLMPDTGGWVEKTVETRVEQRCGDDAVVVRHQVGQGEVVWWSSAMPLTNRGLKRDGSLKLLLASVGGTDRRVLFDEGLEGYGTPLWETAKGLPIWALWTQVAAIGLLLVLSFGRRNGPVRAPFKAIRSSPLEFAQSMGHLYQKAGATQVATEGARARLLQFLHDRCGIAEASLRSAPEEVASAVAAKLGGDWSRLGTHLAEAAKAEHAGIAAASALALVQEFDRDRERAEEQMGRRRKAREETV